LDKEKWRKTSKFSFQKIPTFPEPPLPAPLLQSRLTQWHQHRQLLRGRQCRRRPSSSSKCAGPVAIGSPNPSSSSPAAIASTWSATMRGRKARRRRLRRLLGEEDGKNDVHASSSNNSNHSSNWVGQTQKIGKSRWKIFLNNFSRFNFSARPENLKIFYFLKIEKKNNFKKYHSAIYNKFLKNCCYENPHFHLNNFAESQDTASSKDSIIDFVENSDSPSAAAVANSDDNKMDNKEALEHHKQPPKEEER
jgi:hypothetical protein